MRKRKMEISMFNVMLAMVVILIHLMSVPKTSLPPEVPLYKVFMFASRLCAFVVQAFIFLSGMKTFLGGREEPYGKFLLKRLRTVVLPYAAAVMIYYLYFVYIEKYFPFSIGDYAGYLVRGDLAAHFYFVVVIIQFYLLYPVWKAAAKRLKPAAVLGAAALINIVLGAYSYYWLDKLFNGYVFTFGDRLFTTYILYWVGGMYAGIYYDRFMAFITRHCLLLGVAYAVIAVIDNGALYMQQFRGMAPLHLDMLHLLYCAAAILFWMSVMTAVKDKKIFGLRAADRSSYKVYLFHILFIFLLDEFVTPVIVDKTGLTSTTLTFCLRACMTYGLCFVLIFADNLPRLIKERRSNITGISA